MLTLRLMPWTLSIVRLPGGEVPGWAAQSRFYSITRSPEELSIVCESSAVPSGLLHSGGWKAIRVEGELDLTMVGILAPISAALAEAGISIFAVSTYDTDYILVKAADSQQALETLRQTGYDILP